MQQFSGSATCVDAGSKFLPNASQLKYYNPPAEMKVYENLSRGVNMKLDTSIDVTVQNNPPFLDVALSTLLEWIKRYHKRIAARRETGRWIQPKFVSTHGTFKKLLDPVRDEKDSRIVYAARWKGTIYLDTDESFKKVASSYPCQEKFSSWGHKFEQYVLSKSADELPEPTKPVNTAEEFRCVYQRNIGGHSVMYCSRMKGLLSNKPLTKPLPFDQLNFIQVRTNRIIEFAAQNVNFKKMKALQWWIDCYLTNTKYTLCGFRDDAGVVHKLTLYNVQELIEMGKPYWKPGHCVYICKSVLSKIEETVVRDCDQTIYRFENGPGGQIDTRELSATSEHAFLPSSFLKASG